MLAKTMILTSKQCCLSTASLIDRNIVYTLKNDVKDKLALTFIQ